MTWCRWQPKTHLKLYRRCALNGRQMLTSRSRLSASWVGIAAQLTATNGPDFVAAPPRHVVKVYASNLGFVAPVTPGQEALGRFVVLARPSRTRRLVCVPVIAT